MNKRGIVVLLSAMFIYAAAQAQDESDALRYSRLTSGGTARAQAIGGAMGSLGGDISAMSVNPAGIGIFKTNEFSITPGFRSLNNDASYYNTSASDSKSSLFLQNGGFIFASNKKRNSNSQWQNVTFGIGVNRLANFNSNLFYQGNNSTSSYADNYLIDLSSETNTDNAQNNYPFGPSQAIRTYVIDPYFNDNNQFDAWTSRPGQVLADGKSLIQSNSIATKGGLNEFSLAVAGNYANKFYIGGSLNIPSIKFDRTKTFRETNPGDANAQFDYYDNTEITSTDGVGVNGKLGLIYSPQPAIRLGAAFHTPTIYSMHDTYSTTITAQSVDDQGQSGVFTSSTEDITGGYPGEYQYSLTTPWRAVGSVSYIFNVTPNVAEQHGFITLDYEYVNYAAMRYHFNSSDATAGDKALADELNQSIKHLYKGASNVRVGGELKFDLLAVRAGFAYYGSPYADNSVSNGTRMLYSGGLGYRNRGFYIDLTYVYEHDEDMDQPYYVQPNSLNVPSPEAATYTSGGSNVIFTLGFKL